MRDDEQQVSSVNWSWFSVLAAIVVLAGAATYFLLPSLISKNHTNVTIVKAIEGPIKVKPTEPGGKTIDHTNILVVDILQGALKRMIKQNGCVQWTIPTPPVSVVDKSSPKPQMRQIKPY